MKECFYTRLVEWKDPNLSAAFLTGGNALVLLLLVSGNALAWVQFFIVFCLIPLGFAARLAGLDKHLAELVRPGSPHEQARSYYESHIYAHITAFGLLRLGVYLLVGSQLIARLGIPLMVGLVGNLVMISPLVYNKYAHRVLVSIRVPRVDVIAAWSKSVFTATADSIAAFGPMAPAIAGGLIVFILVIVLGHVASSTSILVANMKLAGYLAVMVCAFSPVDLIERFVRTITPTPATIEQYSQAVHADEWIRRVTELILWENYRASLLAFVSLYCFYYISWYVGVALPIALGCSGFVAFALTPGAIKEKALAEMSKVVNQVKANVEPITTLLPAAPTTADQDTGSTLTPEPDATAADSTDLIDPAAIQQNISTTPPYDRSDE